MKQLSKAAIIFIGIVLSSGISPALSDILKSEDKNKGWYYSLSSGFALDSEADLEATTSDFHPTTLVLRSTEKYTGTSSLGTSFSGELGVGYDFGKIRTELTYGYTPRTSESLSFKDSEGDEVSVPFAHSFNISTVQIGAFYDLQLQSKRWTPYLGASLGTAFVSIDSGSSVVDEDFKIVEEKKDLFSYQLKGGVTYEATKNIDLFFETSYLNIPEFEVKINEDDPDDDITPLSVDSFGNIITKIGVRIRI
tara:strand:+ start:166 stop:918 length:753 start_codon:yes stop_codon:yes gene_type:complete